MILKNKVIFCCYKVFLYLCITIKKVIHLIKLKGMSTTVKNKMREVMQLAHQFIRKNGMSLSEALKTAWVNIKLKAAMKSRIVKFYFTKVSGEIREAYGTLADGIIPAVEGNSSRKQNDTCQTYYDCEKEAWRCFKKANLLRLA